MRSWPTFLINLTENTARLASSVAQFKALGIPFERLDAVNGWTLPDDEVAGVYDLAANLRCARAPLIRPEIGCYLSHIKVWEQIAEGDAKGGVVFEDDFHANDDLLEVLESLPLHSNDFDMIKLFSLRPNGPYIYQRALGPRHQIVIPYRIPNCTLAYTLTKDAAQRMVEKAIPFFRAVDEDLKWFWEKDLRIGLVLPLPVALGNQESAVGTIGSERSIGRKGHKLRSRIARSFRTLSYRVHYEALLHFHRAQRWLQQ